MELLLELLLLDEQDLCFLCFFLSFFNSLTYKKIIISRENEHQLSLYPSSSFSSFVSSFLCESVSNPVSLHEKKSECIVKPTKSPMVLHIV